MKINFSHRDIIMLMQGLNAIWWDADDTRHAEKLEAKLMRAVRAQPDKNARLIEFLESKYPDHSL